jgi:short-subunit dehydrogenase
MDAFKDKIAIITGGASGIGRAVAQQISKRGAVCILADRDYDLAEETAKAIEKAGGKAKPYRLDVTDRTAVKKLVDDTVTEYGRLDYMFNNAGIGIVGETQDFEYEDWKSVIDVDLYGVVHGICAAYPVMVKQGHGHIVNTGSVAGLIPIPGEISYTAAKFAVVGLSHALRTEAAAFGVKVSVVCPGIVNTPILQTGKVIKHARDKMFSLLPPPISPEEMAQAIVRGVERNQRMIIAPFNMKVSWFFYRLFPGAVFMYADRMLKKLHDARTE